MSDLYYLKHNQEKIYLDAKPFAGGGEGNLYHIVKPAIYRKYVAKIYHPHKRNKEREQKIQYLIEHPPIALAENESVGWVWDALYDANYEFVGFVMPLAKGKKLELLCLGKLPKQIGSAWQRFDLRREDAVGYRLRICFNLAAAVYQIHATNHYVLVDLKPENIILQPNGLLVIVDTDSVEVVENGKALYPAPVATPEYSPPEFYTQKHRQNDTVEESWDRFGLAVIFYKLLLGIHPFAATAQPPYDHLVSLHEKIEQGLFVHSPSRKKHLKVIPPPHQGFEQLDESLQELFLRCFEDGHHIPDARPSANEWCSALLMAIGDAELEAHFAHIIGLWGTSLSTKVQWPSTLYKKDAVVFHPQKWIEQSIETVFETAPLLPIALHQAIQRGKQEVKLVLGWQDYVLSWLFLGTTVMVLFGLSSWFRFWLEKGIWALEVWQINVFFLFIWLLLQVGLPRLVSLGRHWFSPQVKLRAIWKRFRQMYPQFQQDTAQIKQLLLSQILEKGRASIEHFEKQKQEHIQQLKHYLDEQDAKVKDLLQTQKKTLQGIYEQYKQQVAANPLLATMKEYSLIALEKRLPKYYQHQLKQLEKEVANLDAYKAIELAYQKELDGKQSIEDLQRQVVDEARCLFHMDYFLEKVWKNNLVERKNMQALLEAKGLVSIRQIKELKKEKQGYLTIVLYAEEDREGPQPTIEISIHEHPRLERFPKLFRSYKEAIHYARLHDIQYDKVYFQERYSAQKNAYQELLEGLNKKYRLQKEAVVQAYVHKEKEKLTIQFEAAKTLLTQLKQQEQEDVLAAEKNCQRLYDQIYANSEIKLEQTIQQLEGLDNHYQEKVNLLLETEEIEKIRISFEKRLINIKQDLEQLKNWDIEPKN